MRWTARKKMAIVDALREGITTCEEVERKYSMSHEELTTWIANSSNGWRGLTATKIREARKENA